MRILVLTNKIPYPAIDGGSIATLNLSIALAKQGNEVTVLAMNTAKHYLSADQIPIDLREKIEILAVDVPAKIRVVGALRNLLFSKLPYTAERFYTTSFSDKLQSVLQENTFDIVQLEGLYVGLYVTLIRKNSRAKIIYRAHNLEFEIWNRAAGRSNFLMKWYFNKLAKRLIKLEKSLLNQYDAILPISSKDGSWFTQNNAKTPLQITPAGITKDFAIAKASRNETDLFFIGALDWLPNQEGLLWFIKEVWPQIHDNYSNLKFYVAGRNASAETQALKAPNLVFLGEIEHAKEFMLTHGIMIVPLFSGSGMRVKIIEAMALGKIVISTTMGLEGNSAKNGIEVLVADDVRSFLEKLEFVLSHPREAQNMGLAAAEFIQQNFDQDLIALQTSQFYKGLIQ
ncbi:MAG: glycosyltransferase [Bacteroidales bacterium]|nr:glycosyltransferase [Bacteroidales bacterium]